MEEIWKDIEGYEGLYQVSNLGRVKSLSRVINNGRCELKRKEKILKNFINDKGYSFNVLYDVNFKRKQHYNHRLVANAFIENKEKKLYVNHINSNTLDNHYSNLEWVTHKENMQHCIDSGRHNMFNGKFRNGKVLVNLENGIFYNSTVEASKLLGISFSRLEYNLKKHNKYNNLVFA